MTGRRLTRIVATSLAALGTRRLRRVRGGKGPGEGLRRARAHREEVEALGKLTPTTITADAVRDSVDTIRDDLEEIGEARDELSEDRREELKAANDAFAAAVRDVAENVLRSTSVADAKTQLTAAADALAESYRSTLGTFDCVEASGARTTRGVPASPRRRACALARAGARARWSSQR